MSPREQESCKRGWACGTSEVTYCGQRVRLYRNEVLLGESKSGKLGKEAEAGKGRKRCPHMTGDSTGLSGGNQEKFMGTNLWGS